MKPGLVAIFYFTGDFFVINLRYLQVLRSTASEFSFFSPFHHPPLNRPYKRRGIDIVSNFLKSLGHNLNSCFNRPRHCKSKSFLLVQHKKCLQFVSHLSPVRPNTNDHVLEALQSPISFTFLIL